MELVLFWKEVEFDMVIKLDGISVAASVTDSFLTGLLAAFVVLAIFSSLGINSSFVVVVALLTIQFRYWDGDHLEIKT